MRRSLFILLAVVLASATIFLAAFRLGGHLGRVHLAKSIDDLDWLRLEFRLSDAELARIRQLHEGYLPKCQSYCAQIAAKKRELQELVASSTNASAAIEQKLAEIATLRAQCQVEMLRHFTEVSRAMPPEQGRRYLAEMQRLTLGFHEQIEQSMSHPSTAGHGHH
jgi:Spy/CpxP family protein refolding chaperone